jgi:hypothetical protein
VKRRLWERERQGNAVSDATWAIAQQEEQSFPPFDDIPDRCHFIINTEESVEDALASVEERLSSPPLP